MNGLPARFWAKVDMSGECWLWTGVPNAGGYGLIQVDGTRWYAHRLAYTILVGPIPDGLQVDHKCRVRLCVNPDHLHPVDGSTNMQNRGGAMATSRSGVRGVHRFGDRWRVQVKAGGRIHSGGLFATVEDANVAAVELRNRLMSNNLADR